MLQTKTSIYQRKDGRFEGRIPDGRLENGRLKYRSVYGCSTAEVQQKIALLCGNSTDDEQASAMSVEWLCQNWLHAVAFRVKESTMSNYYMKIRKHILPAFGNLFCWQITTDQVQQFIAQKMESGLSARYVSDIVILMKSIFRYANQIYQITDPLQHVILPKRKRTEILLLNETQQKQLQIWLQTDLSNTALGVAFSFYTGLRIGEICALRWCDVDFEKQIVTVRHTVQRIQNLQGTPKTKLVITEPKSVASLRTIPLPSCLLTMLHKEQTDPACFILSGTYDPMEPRTLQYRFASLLQKMQLPPIRFHALRHMFATNCIALGFDVKSLSEILGHSSADVTLNRYVHSSMEQKRALMERLSCAA